MHDPPRILVVDDNEANLDIAKMRLESQGYEVVTAADGETALVCVRDADPDLVLLDIMMPKLDGIEVTRRLKRFLAPQIADLIASQSDEQALEYHRREIVVVFCDLRGFTSFAETAEPEEVMGVLKQYLEALGPLVHRHEGTLTRFTGDGIM